MNKKFIRIICAVLSVAMLFTLCSCTVSNEDEEKTIPYKSDVPADKLAVIDRLNAVIADAKNSKPAVSYSLSQGAGGCDCENKYVKAAFKTLADAITKESFSQETKYGESTRDIFPLMGSDKAGCISATDVSTAFITDNVPDKTYTITVTVNGEENPGQNGTFGKLYKIEQDDEIMKNFDIIKDFITAEGYSAVYKQGVIKAVIDKATDHLIKLELKRDVTVTTEVTGNGTLASITTVPLSFNYNSTANYSLDWDNPDTDAIES